MTQNTAPTVLAYRFGIFELDLRRRELRRDGVKVPLQDQPLRLLEALLESQGSILKREELRALFWEPDVHVDFTAGINSAVRRVREALNDDADSPRFVQTVPRRGYRFLAPAERVHSPAETRSQEQAAAAPSIERRKLGWNAAGWLLAALLGALLLVVLARYLPRNDVLTSSGTGTGTGTVTGANDTQIQAHFERARHFSDRRSREGLEKAIAELQSALALEPESDSVRAKGYGGLAVAYVMLGFYDYWRPTDAFEPARAMAERALTIDSNSASGHLAMSLVHAISEWDWSAARVSLERAVAADPSLPEVRLWRAILLSSLQQHDEALAEVDRALVAEPVSPVLNTARGWLLFVGRRSDEAIEQSRRTLELAPNYYDAWDNLKWFHITRGEEAKAARAWARASDLEGGDGDGLLAAYRQHGFPYLLRDSIRKKLSRQDRGYSSPYDLVLDYAALGEIEPALEHLERSHSERETDLVALAVDPRLDPLRDEPRFQELLAALKLASSFNTKELP